MGGPGSGKKIGKGVSKAIKTCYQRGVRGKGAKATAKVLGVSPKTVRKVASPTFRDSPTLNLPRGHRRRLLSKRDEEKMKEYLGVHADATNEQLAKIVHNKIKPRTVSSYLSRSKPKYTKKIILDQEPEELTETWKSNVKHFLKGPLHNIPLNKRIYEDETSIYGNMAKKYGRSPKGFQPKRVRPKYSKKFTLHVYARQKEIVYWKLTDKNADNNEFENLGRLISKRIKNGEALIWDRLGRSGRSKSPKSQHYNPNFVAQITKAGGKVVHLPSKGKYLNPLELLFNDLKNHFLTKEKLGVDKTWNFSELKSQISSYMKHEAPKKLPKFFKQRANGKELFQNFLLSEE